MTNTVAENPVLQKMSVDDFFAMYKPVLNPNCTSYDDSYTWKTAPFEAGKDVDMAAVESMMAKDPRCVWTIHHTDNGSFQYVVNGLRTVNREGFIITEVPFEGEYLQVADTYSALKVKLIMNLRVGRLTADFREAFEDDFKDALEELIDNDDDELFGISLELDDADWSKKYGNTFVSLTVVAVYEKDCQYKVDYEQVRLKLHSIAENIGLVSTFSLEMKDELTPYL